MSRAALELSNAEARRIFLHVHALSHDPADHEGDAAGMVTRLGFVQMDSIQTVARAHHHILHSRLGAYAPAELARLHHEARGVFEHWTHDASVIPMAFYPHWKRKFAATKKRVTANGWWAERMGSRRILKRVRDRIAAEGPLSARAFDDPGEKGQMWGWSRSKAALEYLWHTGELAISGRDGFQKIYDLAENVIPAELRAQRSSKAATTDWACRAALERLGFATPRQIADFWKLIPPEEAAAWAERNARRLVAVSVEDAEGARHAMLALPQIERLRDEAPAPPAIMRALSPFDPALRDRKRLKRLFGFDYTIEIFVPEAKRRFGYYVFPLLDGDRLTGRVDARVDRAAGILAVKRLWDEPDAPRDRAARARRAAALAGLARMGGATDVKMIP